VPDRALRGRPVRQPPARVIQRFRAASPPVPQPAAPDGPHGSGPPSFVPPPAPPRRVPSDSAGPAASAATQLDAASAMAPASVLLHRPPIISTSPSTWASSTAARAAGRLPRTGGRQTSGNSDVKCPRGNTRETSMEICGRSRGIETQSGRFFGPRRSTWREGFPGVSRATVANPRVVSDSPSRRLAPRSRRSRRVRCRPTRRALRVVAARAHPPPRPPVPGPRAARRRSARRPLALGRRGRRDSGAWTGCRRTRCVRRRSS
jgi:hypothetical protein